MEEIKRLGAAALLLLMVLVGVSGCDNVSSQAVPGATPQVQSTAVSSYAGPAPTTADVRAFQANLWGNLVEKCGGCHNATGQSPSFARLDDVNLAYSQVITVVDLSSPADSRLVTKVASGHNCWEVSAKACGEIMTAYITKWAGQGGDSTGRQIQLVPPPVVSASDSRSFPDSSALFASTVHPLLVAHCSGCHVDSAPVPQAPYFAVSDANAAYEAVKISHKLDLDTPANSRLVVRLRNEFHNCWSSDCQVDAQKMEDAIKAFATGVPLTQVDPQLVVSKALTLGQGIIASGGSRYDDNVIALYEFKTGFGNYIYDTSGIEPALHLQLSGLAEVDYKWVGGWGMEFINSKAQGSTSTSRKLYDFIRATGEYSIEAWAVPANVTQESARIVSYSAGTNDRNFTLGQTLYNYDFMHRSSTTNGNGQPALSTPDADEVLKATEQHVVVTFDPLNGRRIYVNGLLTNAIDKQAAGNLNDWDETFALVLGNEVTNNRQWQGKLRLVAIHNRALNQEQVLRNYKVGVGEKFFLLFNVSDVVKLPQSYIMFEVSQFDSYSYLFNRPTFVSLNGDGAVADIPIRAMRIGINGKEASVGQAYRNLNVAVTNSQLLASDQFNARAQTLSTLGTVIALEKGPIIDQFFLSFEQLGSQSNVVVEPQPLQPATPADADPKPDIGLRTFAEINATMAAVTGVSTTQPDVKKSYETIMQQLPTVESIDGFQAAHQVAVSQLAIEYCNALVNDVTLRGSYFPGFDFGAGAATAFNTTVKKDQVRDPLVNRIMGTNLATQPSVVTVKNELDTLIKYLIDPERCGSCDAVRTQTVVKASCAAMLGSAVMLLQ